MAGHNTIFSQDLPALPADRDLTTDALVPLDLSMLSYIRDALRGYNRSSVLARATPAQLNHLALRILWDAQQEMKKVNPDFLTLSIQDQRKALLVKLKEKDFSQAFRAPTFQRCSQVIFKELKQPYNENSPEFVCWSMRQLGVDFDQDAPGFAAYRYLRDVEHYLKDLELYREKIQALWQIKQPVRPPAAPSDPEQVQGLEAYCAELGRSIEDQYRRKLYIAPDYLRQQPEVGAYLQSLGCSESLRALQRIHNDYYTPLSTSRHELTRSPNVRLPAHLPDLAPLTTSLERPLSDLKREIELSYQSVAGRTYQLCDAARNRIPGGNAFGTLVDTLTTSVHAGRGVSHAFQTVGASLQISPGERLFLYSVRSRDGNVTEHLLSPSICLPSRSLPKVNTVQEGPSLIFFEGLRHALVENRNAVVQGLRATFSTQLYGMDFSSLNAAQAAQVDLYAHVARQGIQKSSGITQEAQAQAHLEATYALRRSPAPTESLHWNPPPVTQDTTLGELPGFAALLRSVETRDTLTSIEPDLLALLQRHYHPPVDGGALHRAFESLNETLKAHSHAALASNDRARCRALLVELSKISLKDLANYGHADQETRAKTVACHPFSPQNRYMLLSDVAQQDFMRTHSLRQSLKFNAQPESGKSEVTLGLAGETKNITEIKADLEAQIVLSLKHLYTEPEAQATAKKLVETYWRALSRAERRILERKEEGPVGAYLQLIENMVVNLSSVALDKKAIEAYLAQLEAEIRFLADSEPEETTGSATAKNQSGFTAEHCFSENGNQLTRAEFLALVTHGRLASTFKPTGYQITQPDLRDSGGFWNLFGISEDRVGGSAEDHPFVFRVVDPKGRSANLCLALDENKQEGRLRLMVSEGKTPLDHEVFLLVKMTLHNAKKDQDAFKFTHQAACDKNIFKQFAKELLRQRPDAIIVCEGVEKNPKYKITEKVTAEQQKAWLAEAESELREEFMKTTLESRHGKALASPPRIAHNPEPSESSKFNLFPAPRDPVIARRAPLPQLPVRAQHFSTSMSFDNPIYGGVYPSSDDDEPRLFERAQAAEYAQIFDSNTEGAEDLYSTTANTASQRSRASAAAHYAPSPRGTHSHPRAQRRSTASAHPGATGEYHQVPGQTDSEMSGDDEDIPLLDISPFRDITPGSGSESDDSTDFLLPPRQRVSGTSTVAAPRSALGIGGRHSKGNPTGRGPGHQYQGAAEAMESESDDELSL